MTRAFALILAACATAQPAVPTNTALPPPSLAHTLAPGVSVMALIEKPPLGREVTVDIYEAILDSTESTVPADGEVEVQIHDRRRFVIAPGAALGKLPVVRAPVRVRGMLTADPADNHDPGSLRLVASALEPLALPAPKRLASTADITPLDSYVTVEGTYNAGFEWSTLDGEIWVDFYPHMKTGCVRGPAGRVRVTGFVHQGGGYGHLSHYAREIVATEFLEAKPDCATATARP